VHLNLDGFRITDNLLADKEKLVVIGFPIRLVSVIVLAVLLW